MIPGLPNPRWSMKWSVLGEFKGVVGEEPGRAGTPPPRVDKTALLRHAAGHGEHDLIRMHGEGSLTDNDYGFAPIAIPNVTYYLPIRRSLSHTESFVGFEGSYIHSEEPDGALGSMDAASLQALTAYMAQLDGYDDQLRKVGLYRRLAHEGQSGLHGHVERGHVRTERSGRLSRRGRAARARRRRSSPRAAPVPPGRGRDSSPTSR